jgi:hypothetical protein
MNLTVTEIVFLSVLLVGPWLGLILAARSIRNQLDRRVGEAGDELAEKVRTAVSEAVEEALPTVRREVGGGVRDGADEALPRVREQVREGVSEAIASAVTGGVLGKAGEELVRKGGGVLDALLRPRTDDD